MGAPATHNTADSPGEEAMPFPWFGLFILSALIFTAVTSEFLPTGLLPEIAAELKVSDSQVGLLISLFAGTVVLTAAPLAALTRRFSRKKLVVVVLLVFVVSNVLAAIAPTYEALAGARILSGLAHGLFWAVVGAYSAHLVPKKMIGRAVAITSGGATAAFVLGVPVGTALGNVLGWRLAFAGIAAMILVLVFMAIRFLPPVQHIEELKTGEIALPLRKDPTIPGVVIICLTVVIILTGHNIFYTYIAPFLLGPGAIVEGAIAGILLLYGVGGAIGLVLAGAVTDRFPRAGLAVAIALVAVSVIAIGLFPGVTWLLLSSIFIWGIAFGGIPAILQTRLLHTASLRLRDVAAAYLTTSFNIAIGGGALIGAILLDWISITALPFVDVAIVMVGFVFVLMGEAWLRRRAATPRTREGFVAG
jgi:DHA1 family inner membrane transport protein